MYGNLIQLLTALSAALAAGFGVLYLGRVLSELELAEKHENLPQRLPLFVRLLLPFISVTRPAASGNAFAVWRDMAAPKLWMAGLGDAFTPVDYIALRLVFLIVSLLLIVLGMAAGQILICLALALLFAVYPGVWISSTIRKRQLSIMKALPNVLDLLTLSVESGRDLLSALRDILARRKVDPLGEELLRTFQEIQLGRKRTDALRALTLRVRQADLTAAINAIIQAEELGVSIAQILHIQSDMQRNKRFMLAEKLANEASVKIIIPIILLILPAVFLVLVGPLALRAAAFFR
ncbi:type II secretion system F family protein [Victivallaceae bacterium BBE-744-WT-12]|uniref:Type II secretion system F family protein n=1 Tax=Victivallis lenta TaxID=2606640 RepID=A0A844G0B2_9BACT|nr:type II secretion system F family protein [Victivallis lenta]AVM46365.1 secretion system protein F [Victivallales bacterium CCUG 44730]MBS1452384.1 type II secretion system F family protein [Lentisphaeria bacterium]MBS5530737.1 type II secretion system F family protein [bacterium]MST96028.1 type II secretion system F family protein [Victivallis lenta]HBP05219.1 type II secretion system F family protein [Lentisphaeria bacterium]